MPWSDKPLLPIMPAGAGAERLAARRAGLDWATIKPLIGEDGRSPEPPDPAYQQVLHGVPAADFSADELLYLPRNLRAHRLYGMSPVEQVALTVNIALRREAATLDYYRTGSSPDAFATLPKEWTSDQIRQFQDYFDALMSGNSARRRMLKFMPSDFKLIEARQPPLRMPGTRGPIFWLQNHLLPQFPEQTANKPLIAYSRRGIVTHNGDGGRRGGPSPLPESFPASRARAERARPRAS